MKSIYPLVKWPAARKASENHQSKINNSLIMF